MDMSQMQANLLRWYAANHRPLPWRGDPDIYRVWISEVMLQQTQVATVLPYYERFLTRFPTIESLAAASLDEVLKQWEGLGYYARARNLHKAAQKIVFERAGIWPTDVRGLRDLPGFGEYTAGAIASVVYGLPVPAVDGNVKRVLSRLFAIEDEIDGGAGLKAIRHYATDLALRAAVPGDWTQALMELGALICVPKKPKCLLCPVQAECLANQQGLAASLPRKRRKKPIPHYDVAAGIIYRAANHEQFLIAQRPHEGMLGGLWEFPGGKQEPGETLPQTLKREILEELGIEIDVQEPVTVVKHAFTHFKITLHAFAAQLVRGHPQQLQVADWAWVTLDEVTTYAFGHTDRQIVKVLQQAQSTP